jgi:hypothetical protein
MVRSIIQANGWKPSMMQHALTQCACQHRFKAVALI